MWYLATNFENANHAREQFHQLYPGKPNHDRPGNPWPRRSLDTRIASAITAEARGLCPSTPTKDPSLRRRLGYHDRTTKYAKTNANQPRLANPTGVGIGGSQNQRTQYMVMNGMLQRSLLGTVVGQGWSRVVPQRTEGENPRGANSLPTEKDQSCSAAS